MSHSLRGQSLLSLADVNSETLFKLLKTAMNLKGRLAGGEHESLTKILPGRVIVLVFQKPSLRTRASFEIAIRRLGGSSIYLAPGDVGLDTRERTEDVAKVLGRYADAIVARVFGHDIVERLAQHAGIPVINALSDMYHPCQALADLLTITETFGSPTGVKLTYVGDGNNVAHSLLLASALAGMQITVACPRGYKPNPRVLEIAGRLAIAGASFSVVHDPREGVRDADVIYTDVWASMGEEHEAAERRVAFAGYQVNRELLEAARNGHERVVSGRRLPIVLHCLPAHYGEEITEDVVAEHPEIFEQAENRLHAQMALLAQILRR
ncbi:MAG: ornithine carbamoyltransferase [Candidatus Schekmanbacteria bacterium]|nr:ornithine carbamoyltransferase [Candidatus Schekmanbacteria bacterium]